MLHGRGKFPKVFSGNGLRVGAHGRARHGSCSFLVFIELNYIELHFEFGIVFGMFVPVTGLKEFAWRASAIPRNLIEHGHVGETTDTDCTTASVKTKLAASR